MEEWPLMAGDDREGQGKKKKKTKWNADRPTQRKGKKRERVIRGQVALGRYPRTTHDDGNLPRKDSVGNLATEAEEEKAMGWFQRFLVLVLTRL